MLHDASSLQLYRNEGQWKWRNTSCRSEYGGNSALWMFCLALRKFPNIMNGIVHGKEAATFFWSRLRPALGVWVVPVAHWGRSRRGERRKMMDGFNMVQCDEIPGCQRSFAPPLWSCSGPIRYQWQNKVMNKAEQTDVSGGRKQVESMKDAWNHDTNIHCDAQILRRI